MNSAIYEGWVQHRRSSPRAHAWARKVLVVGAGGLGCPASLALAKAGVAKLTLVDPDDVEPSNLHRQPWHRRSDVGHPKVESAARRLRAAFPRLGVDAVTDAVTARNAGGLFDGHDLVLDATDGTATKFMLSDAAVAAMAIGPGGPCLRCLFEEPKEDAVPSCVQAGVLGPVAGAVGSLMGLWAQGTGAWEGAQRGEATLFTFDAATLAMRQVVVRKAPDCPSCGGRAAPLASARLGRSARCRP